MENSLILGHLPTRYSYHSVLNFIRHSEAPPTAMEISEALCSAGISSSEAWTALQLARERAEQTQFTLLRRNIRMVDYWSEFFPSALRLIEYPPWNLYFLGKLPLSIPTLAIVGSRKPDDYGKNLLEAIVPFLKTSPLQIVSGLAFGIDALAHDCASRCGIRNFAVLGCGVDVLYPTAHLSLAERILKTDGGLLSEFPPGTPPNPRNFPWRNRIISGLADVVWIVQGTAKSGSLHTAVHAGKQGKTVASTPGGVFSGLSELPNRLIQDGAHPVVQAADLDSLLGGFAAIVTH